MLDVIVVGAGIIGAAVAYRLSQAGAAVTVLEASRPAGGTSGNSFAWVNANEKLPRAYHDLNAAGVAEHHRLARELPGSGFYPSGNLEWAVETGGRAHLHGKVARLQAWGYRAEVIEQARAQALAPGVALPPPGRADYALYPDEGWVAAPALVDRLLAAATRAGARVTLPARVAHLVTERGRVIGVVAAGVSYRADAVVDCTGPAAGELLAPLGLRVAHRVSPGLTLLTTPLPAHPERVVHAPGVYLRPDGGGRLLLGSEDVDATLVPADRADAWLTPASPPSQALWRRGEAVLPALARASVEEVRLGWRALPADGLSAVGPVPDLAGYYLVFTHSGVTLAPLLGRLVAAEIITGQPRPELLTFRPDRLVSAAPVHPANAAKG